MANMETITTVRGTTYIRRKKPKELDTYVFVRLSNEMKAELDNAVSKNNTTVAKISREFYEKYIKENK